MWAIHFKLCRYRYRKRFQNERRLYKGEAFSHSQDYFEGPPLSFQLLSQPRPPGEGTVERPRRS